MSYKNKEYMQSGHYWLFDRFDSPADICCMAFNDSPHQGMLRSSGWNALSFYCGSLSLRKMVHIRQYQPGQLWRPLRARKTYQWCTVYLWSWRKKGGDSFASNYSTKHNRAVLPGDGHSLATRQKSKSALANQTFTTAKDNSTTCVYYILPRVQTSRFKSVFINRCLFNSN